MSNGVDLVHAVACTTGSGRSFMAASYSLNTRTFLRISYRNDAFYLKADRDLIISNTQ